MKVKVNVPGLSKTSCLELGQDIGKIERNLHLSWMSANMGGTYGQDPLNYAKHALNDIQMMAVRFPKSKDALSKVSKSLGGMWSGKKIQKKHLLKRLTEASKAWLPIRKEAYRTCS